MSHSLKTYVCVFHKNIIYIEPSYVLEDNHICRMQDGILKYTPGIVVRVTPEQNELIDIHGFTRNDKQSFISNKYIGNKKISIQKIRTENDENPG